ncbi:MAG: polysaccharide biosynthesis/export family protein, partial [bacterium]
MNYIKKLYFLDNIKFILVISLLISLSFNRSAGQSMKSLTIFRPGDAINLVVWEYLYEERRNLDFSGVYPINPEGNVALPLVGEIKIKALTLDEATELITEKYSEYLRSPYVYVRPLIRITMQGAFAEPGVYRIDPSKSLWDLVAVAGGPRAGADLERLQVKRG